LLPYVGKIKDIHIGKEKIGINGKEYNPAVLLNDMNEIQLHKQI